ncbi:MAG: DUF4399 domain-containing protein [Gaiellaceae bacterium]
MPVRRPVFHDQSLRPLWRSLALLVLFAAAACGGGEDDDAEPAAPAAVSITSPDDGATVESTFPVVMEADGFTVEPAGEVTEGAGHFHLMVDAECLAAGEQIPADDFHIHLADGSAETELTLPAGEHTLCLQAGDGKHAALDLTDQVTVTIAGAGGETTTEADEGEAIEDWEGRYEGEVVWDCGAAGRHRGTLEAELLILTYPGGRAAMEAFHTVTGSCADAGSRTTAILIQGKRTATGFTFPSTGWGIPGRFNLRVNGDRAEGRVSGEIPGPATMTIVFDLECTFGC